MGKTGDKTVSKRIVLFVPGFDPNPSRRYRELFRKEAPKQAQISDYDVEMMGMPGQPGAWRTQADHDGLKTETRFEVLNWADIVRDNMRGGLIGAYIALLRAFWVFASTGAMFRLMRLRKGPIIAGFYPVFILISALVLAIGLGAAVGSTIAAQSLWAGWAVGLGVGLLVLKVLQWSDNRHFALYLMHDLAFASSARGAWPSELSGRIDAFGERISAAVGEGADEVLVVGHSSGTQIAVSALSRALKYHQGVPVSLLTLGQTIPMQSCLPDAEGLRADLLHLSTSNDVTWVDVSAPGDGVSFALCDPVAVSGLTPLHKRGPLVLSAAFRETLSEAARKALRWRFFRTHIQYLCAFDQPRGYDYFAITTGPSTLADRYLGRAPSPSRIETPARAA